MDASNLGALSGEKRGVDGIEGDSDDGVRERLDFDGGVREKLDFDASDMGNLSREKRRVDEIGGDFDGGVPERLDFDASKMGSLSGGKRRVDEIGDDFNGGVRERLNFDASNLGGLSGEKRGVDGIGGDVNGGVCERLDFDASDMGNLSEEKKRVYEIKGDFDGGVREILNFDASNLGGLSGEKRGIDGIGGDFDDGVRERLDFNVGVREKLDFDASDMGNLNGEKKRVDEIGDDFDGGVRERFDFDASNMGSLSMEKRRVYETGGDFDGGVRERLNFDALNMRSLSGEKRWVDEIGGDLAAGVSEKIDFDGGVCDRLDLDKLNLYDLSGRKRGIDEIGGHLDGGVCKRFGFDAGFSERLNFDGGVCGKRRVGMFDSIDGGFSAGKGAVEDVNEAANLFSGDLAMGRNEVVGEMESGKVGERSCGLEGKKAMHFNFNVSVSDGVEFVESSIGVGKNVGVRDVVDEECVEVVNISSDEEEELVVVGDYKGKGKLIENDASFGSNSGLYLDLKDIYELDQAAGGSLDGGSRYNTREKGKSKDVQPWMSHGGDPWDTDVLYNLEHLMDSVSPVDVQLPEIFQQNEIGAGLGFQQNEIGAGLGFQQNEIGAGLGFQQNEIGAGLGFQQNEIGAGLGFQQNEIGAGLGFQQNEIGAGLGFQQNEIGAGLGFQQNVIGVGLGFQQNVIGVGLGFQQNELNPLNWQHNTELRFQREQDAREFELNMEENAREFERRREQWARIAEELRQRRLEERRRAHRRFARPLEEDGSSENEQNLLSTARNIHSEKKSQPMIRWKPSGNRENNTARRFVPSLLDLSLNALADNADMIVSLEGVPYLLKQRLSNLLCDARKMNVKVLDLFIRDSPEEICLKDTSWITENQLKESFGSFDPTNLKVFQFDLCGQCVSDDIIAETLARDLCSLPGLRIISLRGACRLSDEGLKALVKLAPALCSLNLGECSLLTHVGINYIADALGNSLRELFIDNCSRIDAKNIASAFEKFKHMEVLSVAGILNLSDGVISDIISACGKNIKDLDLADCERLTDSSLKFIGQNCSDLHALNIVNVHNLTDMGLSFLANSCKSIRSLKLCRNKFSDEAIAEFIEIAGRSLEELSLNHVSQVGSFTAVSLAKFSPRLSSLDLSWCRKVTDEALGLIVDSCWSLKLLKLFGCTQITKVFLDGHSNSLVQIIGLDMTSLLERVGLLKPEEVYLRYSPLPIPC